jgi:hypothetical protein
MVTEEEEVQAKRTRSIFNKTIAENFPYHAHSGTRGL